MEHHEYASLFPMLPDAERLWLIAQSHLDKILPTDKSREQVLREVIAYAEKRIADAK